MKLTKVGSNMRQGMKQDGTLILLSYETPVAALVPGRGYVRTDTKWSQSTTRHINKWLGGLEAELVPQDFLNELYKS